MHGRPRPFRGSWYSSIFVHYYPTRRWKERNHLHESHCAVPPHWVEKPYAERRHPRLEIVGTALRETGCPDDWCRAQHSVKWGGPGKEGAVITPTFEKIPFRPEITNEALVL
jgi:hypothetical protein